MLRASAKQIELSSGEQVSQTWQETLEEAPFLANQFKQNVLIV